jgi:hypothetical protein
MSLLARHTLVCTIKIIGRDCIEALDGCSQFAEGLLGRAGVHDGAGTGDIVTFSISKRRA